MKQLKITLIGFDWDNNAQKRQNFLFNKYKRDNLQVETNSFLALYGGGNPIKRVLIRKDPKFIVWQLFLFTRLRIIYDFLFIFILPLVLLKEKYKPDLYYLSDFPHILAAIIPAKLLKSKIYFRLVNLPTQLALQKGAKGRIYFVYYWCIERITCRLVDRYIVINKTTRQYLLDLGIKEEKIIFDVPNTIERDRKLISKAEEEYIRDRYNISRDTKILLSIGSLIPEKGFAELIKAFARLKRDDLILIICGSGKEKDNLGDLANKLGLSRKIIFTGYVERDKIWHYIKGADLFILFSKSESLGMVFLEAMYMNIPLIGTKVRGVKETIGQDGERGFYWLNNTDDLENKINILLDNDSDKKNKMIAGAYQYVERKLLSKNKINDIYKKEG